MVADPQLLTDIRLQLRQAELRSVYTVATDERRVPNQPGQLVDLGLVEGRDNLGQAVIIRLLTPRGELAALGHPEYGSRLHEVIGQQNTATTRNLIKLYILESLQQEPRIESVVGVTVEPDLGRRDLVTVLVRVNPIGEATTVTIGPFILELES